MLKQYEGKMSQHNKIDRRFRLARIWSNDELKKIAHYFDGRVVNVSAGEDEDKQGDTYRRYFSIAESYQITNYAPGSYRGFQGRPDEILLDLTEPLPDDLKGVFDVVFNHTTLEHIFDVQTAFSNLCTMTSDVAIIVVPFSQVQHENEGYMDYWRFTPTCMRKLFEINTMKVIYESMNTDRNAAIYLFFVGSRHPEIWAGRMPAFETIVCAGEGIGFVPQARWTGIKKHFKLGVIARKVLDRLR